MKRENVGVLFVTLDIGQSVTVEHTGGQKIELTYIKKKGRCVNVRIIADKSYDIQRDRNRPESVGVNHE